MPARSLLSTENRTWRSLRTFVPDRYRPSRFEALQAQLGDTDLKPIIDAESQRQGAGEARLEVEESNPFRCNGDPHHLLNHRA